MSFDDSLNVAHRWLNEGRTIALAIVIETWGSAPRDVGSILVIDSQGNFEGSVSGGCVEGSVVGEATDILTQNRGSQVLEFGVADETAWSVGLSCGGKIRIYVFPIGESGMSPSILTALHESQTSRVPIATITDLTTGEISIYDSTAAHPMSNHIDSQFRLSRSGCVFDGDKEFFINIYVPSCRLVLIGAVHIAQHLYPMAQSCSFDVLIVDPRTAFATSNRFSGVRLLCEWPQDVLSELSLDSFTALAALSHDPKIDDVALIEALRSDCFYVGALGSRKTHDKRLKRLKELGVSDSHCNSISSPIGLDIAASGPAEIAVSILSQIISRRRGGQLP